MISLYTHDILHSAGSGMLVIGDAGGRGFGKGGAGGERR